MRLIHHSAEPFTFDPGYVYDKHHLTGMVGKPHGIWLSDEDDHGWRAWCESEDWGTHTLANETEFRLAPGHNVLVIETPEALDAFAAEYADNSAPYLLGIDWAAVVECYDGIIITPYQWVNRYRHHFYYGWDCASGCIWNLAAIEPVLTPIR